MAYLCCKCGRASCDCVLHDTIDYLTKENELLKKKLAILQSDMVAIAYQAEQSLKQTK